MRRGLHVGKLGALFVLLMTFLWGLYPGNVILARAEYYYYDYIADEYDVLAVVDEDHTIHVTENIDVDFLYNNHHGIYRVIPLGVGQEKSDDIVYDIQNIECDGWDYDVDYDDEYITIQIGDADVYLSGAQHFTISYDVVGYTDNDSAYDSFALNLLPTQWDTEITEAKLTLTMPKSVDWSAMKLYEGTYGDGGDSFVAGDSGSFFESYVDEDSNTVTIVGKELPEYYGLTARDTELEEGYWEGTKSYREAHTVEYILLFLLSAFAAVGAFLCWFFVGRDKHMTKVLEFHAPEGLHPAEIGYLLDGQVSEREMMTLVFYLAHKGYLRIEEYSKDEYKLVKVQDPGEDEKKEIRRFYSGIFGGTDTRRLEDIKPEFHDVLDDCKTRIETRFTTGKKKDRAYRKGSLVAQLIFLIVLALLPALMLLVHNGSLFMNFIGTEILLIPGMILLIYSYEHRNSDGKKWLVSLAITLALLSLIFYGYSMATVTGMVLGVLMAISLGVIMFFTLFMSARTDDNTVLMGRILGFREFIKTAEYDRLRKLVADNPEYFYEILPYAEVFGLETAWAEKFIKIQIPKPDWYDTYELGTFTYSPFWYYGMTHHIHHCLPVREVNMSNLNGSGHMGQGGLGGLGGSGGIGGTGGFSGGGFSGGGFGGGGGGAW